MIVEVTERHKELLHLKHRGVFSHSEGLRRPIKVLIDCVCPAIAKYKTCCPDRVTVNVYYCYAEMMEST